MIRIITGIAKNKKLKIPKIEGFRSVQDVAKGALFSILGETVIGAICLDIYAGSGSLGLEALSRGATSCDFVDEQKECTKVIEENIHSCGFSDRTEVITKDAVKYVGNTDKKYDLIFVDPFYNTVTHVFLVKNLEEILNEHGKIVFFHGDNLSMSKLLSGTKMVISLERRFGKSYFSILAKK